MREGLLNGTGGLDALTLCLQLKVDEDPKKEMRSFRLPLTRKSCPEVSLFQKGLTILREYETTKIQKQAVLSNLLRVKVCYEPALNAEKLCA